MEPVVIGLSLSLLLIGWIDWRWHRIWHVTTISVSIIAFWSASDLPTGSRANALAGAMLAFMLFFLIWWIANQWYQFAALGFGDVMLATAIGMIGGLYWGMWMLATGMLLAGIVSGLALYLNWRTRLDTIPYGSFLALCSLLGLLYFGCGR